jgi:hypothetical protein
MLPPDEPGRVRARGHLEVGAVFPAMTLSERPWSSPLPC